MELERSMRDPAPRTCPQCRQGGLEQVFQAYFHKPCDSGQENENRGAGKFYPQLGKRYLDPYTKTTLNPAAHARTRDQAIEQAKRQGYQGIEKC